MFTCLPTDISAVTYEVSPELCGVGDGSVISWLRISVSTDLGSHCQASQGRADTSGGWRIIAGLRVSNSSKPSRRRLTRALVLYNYRFLGACQAVLAS